MEPSLLTWALYFFRERATARTSPALANMPPSRRTRATI